MKRIIFLPLLLVHAVQALSPKDRASIRDLIKKIEHGEVRGSCIWYEIEELRIPEEEDNAPIVEELNTIAINSLRNDTYDVSPDARLTHDIRRGKVRPHAPEGNIVLVLPPIRYENSATYSH